MENYVYKKEVDWSLFNYGFAIPLEYQVVFKQIADRFIERGESKTIHLYLNGKSYDAKVNNNKIADRYGNRADIVQVRYTQSSEIAAVLRELFHCSYSYISSMKKLQEPGSKKRIVLPEEYKEYLAVYTTEDDDSYILEVIPADEINALRENVQGRSESLVESEMSYEANDPGAGIQVDRRLVKIRKLNRLIGENLKLLYGYRCQICGMLIGEEYGSAIAEAHHIDYFVKSLNNSSDNQMIVCPNHHRIIHDADPYFDRGKRIYVYKNGVQQGLALNKHLWDQTSTRLKH